MQRRRESHQAHRTMVILVDGFATLKDEYQDYEGQQMLDAFYRVYADGPAVGMHFAVTTTRAKAVPSAMDEVTTQRWVYRLADPYDYSSLGIKGKDLPAPVPGRCVSSATLLQMHSATPDHGLESAIAEATAKWAHIQAKPDAVGALPDNVPASRFTGLVDLAAEPIRIPVGLREDTLSPALLDLYEGEHVLITGPARSGKSTLLLAIAGVLRAAPEDQRPVVWGIYDRRSPLRGAGLDRYAENADEIPALLAMLRLETRPVFLLIDDAERVEDADQSLTSLLNTAPPNLHAIAAGRGSDLRSLYSHWTKSVRKARCGVLLQPDIDYDGELLGARIPRNAYPRSRPVAGTRAWAGRSSSCRPPAPWGDCSSSASSAERGGPAGASE